MRLGLLLVSLFIPLFFGGLAGWLTMPDTDIYDTISLPPFAPPGWIFPAAWLALYTFMGIACYLALRSEKGKEKGWKWLYGITILLNFCWPFLFFTLKQFALSAWLIVAMLVIGAALTREYFRIRKASAWLLVPYLLWLAFAALLCFSIAGLN